MIIHLLVSSIILTGHQRRVFGTAVIFQVVDDELIIIIFVTFKQDTSSIF